MPHAENQKAQQDPDQAADTVVSGFEFVDINMKVGGYFFDKQLIYFRGDVSMEHG